MSTSTKPETDQRKAQRPGALPHRNLPTTGPELDIDRAAPAKAHWMAEYRGKALHSGPTAVTCLASAARTQEGAPAAGVRTPVQVRRGNAVVCRSHRAGARSGEHGAGTAKAGERS